MFVYFIVHKSQLSIWGMHRFVYRSTGRQNCSSKYPSSLKRLYASRVWLPPVTSIVAVFGFCKSGMFISHSFFCIYNPYQGCIVKIWHFYLGTNVCHMVGFQSPDGTVFRGWEQVCQEHKDSWTYKVEVWTICLFANAKYCTYQYQLTVLSTPLCLYVSCRSSHQRPRPCRCWAWL